MNEKEVIITTITINIAENKKGTFKATCAKTKKTMRTVLIGAIEDYILENGGKV